MRQIEFRVLGPVEARLGEAVVPVGGRRQRALLGLLLADAGRPVDTDRLIDELWAGEPPDGAEVTLRSYVSRLRAALGVHAPIAATPAGYVLDVAPERIDARRFEVLVREAEAAREARNPRRVAAKARDALAQWHGRPFAGLSAEGALRANATRLEELRLHALELRMEADLALGSAGELVDELESLVAEHPYHETFWRHLMLALYRAQRQADALGAYHRARTALDEELGVEPGKALRDLEAAILRHDVPVVELPEERQNLPNPLTSFVGRESELETVAGLLAANRLVTLTGVGGVGKTRLAIEAARRAVADHADGVTFVDLAPLNDASLVPAIVAAAIGIRERPGTQPLESLAGQLRARALLVVLDNCEHLKEACADLTRLILAGSPGVRFLATSREPLGVPGEVDHPVQPLGLVDGAGPEAIRASEAVQLFLARAHAARPGLTEDDASLDVAARICADLDGLPLAMELAAARVKALSLADIAARLDDRFRFLVSWRRLTSARHRTLREAMDWSFQLLAPAEQALLAQLSVFAGGFTLEAVAAVCLDGDDVQALELLERLVDASLVAVDDGVDETRYRLLETVRQYGSDQLREAGQTAEFTKRHAVYYAALIEAIWVPVRDDAIGSVEWLQRMTRERANLRVALAWTRDAPDPMLRLRMAEAHWYFWWIRGDLSEGRAWLEPAIDDAVGADGLLVTLARTGAAGLAWAHGDLDRAWSHAATARTELSTLGKPLLEANSLNTLALIALHRADDAAAEALLGEAIALEEINPDLRNRSINLAIFRNNLGEVAMTRGDFSGALREFIEARALYEGQGEVAGVAMVDLNLGGLAVRQGRFDDARRLLRVGVLVNSRDGFLQRLAEATEAVGALANAVGVPGEAAMLLGAATRIREQIGAPAFAWNADQRDREIDATRVAMGEAAAAAAFERGARLTDREVVDRALAFLAD